MTDNLADDAGKWRGIPTDRVVAVLADLRSGLTQVGSGYLVTGRRILTAYHCLIDAATRQPASSLRVVRRSDGTVAQAVVVASALDVAVLEVTDNSAWPSMLLEPVRFGRVDRQRSMELRDCQAIGFPAWQVDPEDRGRNAAELHGTIRATEDMESGYLVMRDTALADVGLPAVGGKDLQDAPWRGLSGALVFYRGFALGVIIEHHLRQGRSAFRILPVDQLSSAASGPGFGLSEKDRFAGTSPDTESEVSAVAVALALPLADEFPLVEGADLPIGRTRAIDGIPPGSAGSADGTVTVDVIMRGPLQALGIAGLFDDAAAREQVDPASAASDLVEIAKQLVAQGFAPHGEAIRRRAVQAYATAGRRSDAIRLQLQLVSEVLLAGRWSDTSMQIVVLDHLMDGSGDVLSAGLAAAGYALQAVTRLLEDPVLGPENVSATFNATVGHVKAVIEQLTIDAADFVLLLTVAATAAVTAAEVAFAADMWTLLTAASATFDQIVEALRANSNTSFARLRIRLRLATAEAEDPDAEQGDRWRQLHQEAEGWKLDAQDAALVFARYARAKAIGAAPVEANLAWRRAVEFGGRAKLFLDTADWLSAQWRLHHLYGPIDIKEIQDLRQMTQQLAKQASDRLIPVDDAYLECLEAMRRDDRELRSAALAAQRLRVLSAAAGLWEEELRAHNLLSDIFERSGEPALAVIHRVRAGQAQSRNIALRATAGFVDITPELRRRAPVERAAAYAILAAQGDLIPDSLVELVGSRAADDLEQVRDGKIVETPFAGPGVLRTATDAAAVVAARLPADVSERLMSALDGRLTTEKGTFAWTDESHLKLLATLAASDDDRTSASALDRLLRLLAIQSPALRTGGLSLELAVRCRPADVRRVLVTLAQKGNDEAAEMLAGWSLTGSAGRTTSRDPVEQSAWLAALPFAQHAMKRLAAAPAGVPGSASLFVHFARDAVLVTILDASDIDRALTGLLRVAADRLHLSATRQQALDAASILVAGETGDGLGSRRLSEVFDIACEYARAERDGSAMDELTGFAHPLSSFRIEMGDATFVGGGLHLAARAARGDDQRITVLELAEAILRSEPTETVLHNVGRAFVALRSLDGGPDSLSVVVLARSQSPSLRAVSAVYWADVYGPAIAPSDPASTGAALARDASVIVRRSLIGQLAIASAEAGLSPAGRGVVEAMARDPVADIRKSATAILAR